MGREEATRWRQVVVFKGQVLYLYIESLTRRHEKEFCEEQACGTISL